MAIPDHLVGMSDYQDAVLDILRTNIATVCAAIQAQIDARTAPFTLPVPRAEDIHRGFHPQMLIQKFPAIVIGDLDHRPGYIPTAGAGRGKTSVVIYVFAGFKRKNSRNGVVAHSIIDAMERTAAILSAAVIAILENKLHVAGVIWNPQISRARMVERHPLARHNELTVKAMKIEASASVAHRVSEGLSTP